ncbi:WD40 repeat-like protein [Ramicandelaber brevisporus]|nr:WD40 repeat-like protein [Ramicandelaber brevisporus]
MMVRHKSTMLGTKNNFDKVVSYAMYASKCIQSASQSVKKQHESHPRYSDCDDLFTQSMSIPTAGLASQLELVTQNILRYMITNLGGRCSSTDPFMSFSTTAKTSDDAIKASVRIKSSVQNRVTESPASGIFSLHGKILVRPTLFGESGHIAVYIYRPMVSTWSQIGTLHLPFTGHAAVCTALSVSPFRAGFAAAASNYGEVVVVQINEHDLKSSVSTVLHPLSSAGDNSAIRSVCWLHADHLATGDAAGRIRIWSKRTNSHLAATAATSAATAGLKTSATFKLSATLSVHTQMITRLKLNPYDSRYLASSSLDGTVCIWDLSKPSAEPLDNPAAAQAGIPSALVFRHFGHTHPVADFDWHPASTSALTIASIDCGAFGVPGSVQVWTPYNFHFNI